MIIVYNYLFLDLSMTIIGCLPSIKFLHHLNLSMVFQETIVKIGRPEFFLLILPKNYLVNNQTSKCFIDFIT